MTVLRIDIETFSSIDLPKCGVHRYVESLDFEILLFGYAFGDGPVNVIDLASGEAIPDYILRSLEDPATTKAAFNAAFEIECLSKHLGRRLDPAQWRCTSVHALYLGLPGNLGDVARVVGLPEDRQKMTVGRSLIRYFCLPCKPTKSNGGRTRNLPHHAPEKWALFRGYCGRDVEVERDVSKRFGAFPFPAVEQRLWAIDQRMMTTGVAVEPVLVSNAVAMDQRAKERLTAEAIALTGLSNPSSRDQLIAWLTEEQGEEVDDLKKKTVPRIIERTGSEVVRRVLRLRQELAKTSVTKFLAMSRAMCNDRAIRGLTQFYGANRTGRWAGRLVQVQNLPQNKLRDIDLARRLVLAGDYDSLEVLFDNVPDTLSQLIRTAFVARPGKKLVIVDFSAIEARVIAWMAWCAWRLEVFATHGKIYEASAEQMFKLPPGSVTKKSPYRQRGKVSELALGYQGSTNALITMGALEMGLTEDELPGIVRAWREANTEIVDLWYAVERAALQAVRGKDCVSLAIAGGRAQVIFAYASGMLIVTLPSQRQLFYVKPVILAEDLVREAPNGGTYVAARAGSLTYEGTDQKTKRWTRLPTYGGKLVENLVQAIARDCLREALFGLVADGFTPLATVHDEVICEEDIDGPNDVRAAELVMGRPILWAPGLQLRGDGFETPYYMKEID